MTESTAIKRIIRGDDEIPPERMQDESDFARQLEAWLEAQVLRIATASQGGNPPDRAFWKAENALLAAFLVGFLVQWVQSGIGQAADLLAQVGIGVDESVNLEGEQWAESHAEQLARNLNKTSEGLSKVRIGVWAGIALGVGSLITSLREVIRPKWRLELIAITEGTRAREKGATTAIIRTPKATAIWYTRKDERVCPICRPLHGQRANKNGIFPGGFASPPAHPRCRCTTSVEL